MGNNLARRVQEANGGSGTEVAERAPATLADEIRTMTDQFQMAMPRGMEAARLIRDALTCLRTTRNLAKCERTSVLGGLMTCAQLGLRPGVLGHAWLLPFWSGRNKQYEAQLVIGYQGYRELAQRTGQINTLVGRVVHEHDTFDIDYGIADNLVHKPRLDGDRGEPVGYYTIVKYTSGGYTFWYMSKAECEAHRDRYAMSREGEWQNGRRIGDKVDADGRPVITGPWRDNFDEMALKTTFLKLARWMPKSTELASAIEADEKVRIDLSPNPDALLHGERPVLDGEVVDEPDPADEAVTPTEPAAPPEPDVDEPSTAAAVPAEAEDRAPVELVRKLRKELADLGITRAEDQRAIAGQLLGRMVRGLDHITTQEGARLADDLATARGSDEPAKALDYIIGARKDGQA